MDESGQVSDSLLSMLSDKNFEEVDRTGDASPDDNNEECDDVFEYRSSDSKQTSVIKLITRSLIVLSDHCWDWFTHLTRDSRKQSGTVTCLLTNWQVARRSLPRNCWNTSEKSGWKDPMNYNSGITQVMKDREPTTIVKATTTDWVRRFQDIPIPISGFRQSEMSWRVPWQMLWLVNWEMQTWGGTHGRRQLQLRRPELSCWKNSRKTWSLCQPTSKQLAVIYQQQLKLRMQLMKKEIFSSILSLEKRMWPSKCSSFTSCSHPRWFHYWWKVKIWFNQKVSLFNLL